MAVLCTQANQCEVSASVIEHIHEQFMVGINDNKIQAMLLCDVKDTSIQGEVLGITHHIESHCLKCNVLSTNAQRFDSVQGHGQGCNYVNGWDRGGSKGHGNCSKSRIWDGNCIYYGQQHTPKQCPAYVEDCN